ncbi:MAG: dTMP kinase [Peptococcaceae bacterium]|nr:dTMP kinase [Peptococcaceae bacterium]
MDGLLISFEGPEGAGKTTQIQLLAKSLEPLGVPVEIIREPGGTILGEKIREILLDPDQKICPEAEVMLYAAARAELVQTVIKPCLRNGTILLCDRFLDASIAYQGGGRGLGANQVRQANNLAVAGICPKLTVLLDIEPKNGLNRIRTRQSLPDRIERESISFHTTVRQAYLTAAAAEPDRFMVIDALLSPEQINAVIKAKVLELIND